MSFNVAKCCVLRISRKRRNLQHQAYTIKGTTLKEVHQHPYLGVELTSNLSWESQVDKVATKANCMLGMIRRNLSGFSTKKIREAAFTCLVRPHLEYACSVWDPHLSKHINKLEGIQNRGARFVTGKYGIDVHVTELKKELKWQPLQNRRFVARHSLFFKSIQDQVAIPKPSYISQPPRVLKGHHSLSFTNMRCNTDAYRFTFFPRTIRAWNMLPHDVVESKSTDTFKSRLWDQIEKGNIDIVPPCNCKVMGLHSKVY